MVDLVYYHLLIQELNKANVNLLAVSKTKPIEDIQTLYDAGQRDFGENYVQELLEKHQQLPADIRWHFIGHLQRNKIKQLAPFVHSIQGIDDFSKLVEINKYAAQNNRNINCYLQVHIAQEETKFGLGNTDLVEFMEYYEAQKTDLQNVTIVGLMGMATQTDDENLIASEFQNLKSLFNFTKSRNFIGIDTFSQLSMGMSHDYKIAIQEGATMVRIGSLLFGNRNYNK